MSLPPSPAAGADALRRIYGASINLSALNSEIGSLAEMLYDEDPEVVEQATADLEALLLAEEDGKAALIDRCDQALAIADVLVGQAALRRAQSKRLQVLAQADEALIEKLQAVAIKVLRLAHPDDTRISLPAHEIKSRASEAVEIDANPDSDTFVNPEKLPTELVRTKVEPDKAAIKAFLKAGGRFPGLSLVKRLNWSVDQPK